MTRDRSVRGSAAAAQHLSSRSRKSSRLPNWRSRRRWSSHQDALAFGSQIARSARQFTHFNIPSRTLLHQNGIFQDSRQARSREYRPSNPSSHIDFDEKKPRVSLSGRRNIPAEEARLEDEEIARMQKQGHGCKGRQRTNERPESSIARDTAPHCWEGSSGTCTAH